MTTDTPPNSDTDAEPGSRDTYIEFAATIAVMLGLAALGFGTGIHVSLLSVQGAVVDSTQLPLEMQVDDSLYQTLLAMQSMANQALYAAAALLVGGGMGLERHHLKDQLQAVADRLEASDDDGGDRS